MILGGIDAGGTKCKCILINEDGEVLASSVAGPANYQVVGLEKAVQEIKKVLDLACQQVSVDHLSCLGIGMAGAGRSEDIKKISEKLLPLNRVKETYLTDDAQIALLAAHGGKPGLVLIAGTGSIVYGLRADGTRIRAGGWGPLLGDEGSGFWIALKALHAAIKSEEDRGPLTSLVEIIKNHFKINDLKSLISIVYQERLPRKLIASLTPLVIDNAADGDYVARKIVEEGLDELILTIQSVFLSLNDPTLSIVVSGGLFDNSYLYELFVEKLCDAGDYQLVSAQFEPVYGALIYAANQSGIDISCLEKR